MSNDFSIKYRPDKFEDFKGNSATVGMLERFLDDENRPRAYIFEGSYGCGKTTLAKLMASKLGIGKLDLKEMNCSDFTGVDDMRNNIIRTIRIKAWGGNNKGYILDEVQKLSNSAQNSLLKDLETPPPGVYFFLCTTEPEKIIKPLVNRCIECHVEKLRRSTMGDLLFQVIDREGLEVSKDIVETIINAAEGIPRTALKMLNKIIGVTDIEEVIDLVSQVNVKEKEIIDIARMVVKGEKFSTILNVYLKIKADPENIRRAILGYLNACFKMDKSNSDYRKFAYLISIFSPNLFSSGKAGLTLMIYDACNMGGKNE